MATWWLFAVALVGCVDAERPRWYPFRWCS
jgi:hypothetical protein